MPSSPVHRLRVASVVRETHDSVSVAFDVPVHLADRFLHLPGQFLTLRVPVPGGGWAARCYSLSSAPGDGPPTITVKRVRDGLASNWICDSLTPGSEVEVLLPAGAFVPREEHEDLLLLAGGSGITPIMSILRARMARQGTRAVLIYANRDERSVIFADELRKLSAGHPGRLLVIHLLESVQGLPTVDQLARLCAPFASADAALICGPGPFMDAVAAALARAGMAGERVLTEKFRSLESDPFALPEPAAQAGEGADAGAGATVDVELDGERRTLDWPAQTLLLDLLRANGLDAPFSCREGACSACACRLLAGEVKMLRNEVLEEEDLADGYILACQSLPVSDHVEVTYN
ncbi:ferredoxin--NADP reductase [Trebonia kvetii]|uniref:Ferredoxin--NADP reductase n=1 Tax=Trebonia kvetii TaxID=2480626 RepID=A0A6P2BVD5_9ACTN|nr:ferredoxin--NADP reductase [Trebonia kvetii]TVZ02196.1 ferredoxin--NADP reductase [Trebonia kvetii]